MRAILGVVSGIAVVGLWLCLMALPVLWYGSWRTGRTRRVVRRTPVSTCADLPAGQRAAVVARTAAGPDGPVVAPLSETPCVWYRLVVKREIHDNDGAVAHLTMLNHPSAPTFPVEDGTGRVAVAHQLLNDELPGNEVTERRVYEIAPWGRLRDWLPGTQLAEIVRMELIPAARLDTDSSTLRYLVEEHTVAPGQDVYVLGAARGQGLGRARLRIGGVSTLPAEEVRLRAAELSRDAWSSVRRLALVAAGLAALLLILAVVQAVFGDP